MQACLSVRSTVLRESSTTQATHANRALPKPYPLLASPHGVSSSAKIAQLPTASYRILINRLFTHDDASPTTS